MIKWLVEEFKKMLPVALFFLVAFLLVDMTDRLLNKNALTTYSIISCVVEALIMGKIVLLADYLRVINLCSDKPLIYVTIWKSFLYVCCSIVLRSIEHWIGGLTLAEIFAHMQTPLFWLAQAWLAYLFIIFVAYRELISKVGAAKVKQMFFGK